MAIRATAYHTGKHLTETDLGPVETQCPLCLLESDRKPVLVLQRDPDVHLLTCQRCAASSASRMPTDAALRSYYSHYYDRPGEKVTCDDPDAFAAHFLQRVGRRVAEGTKIHVLDFGGGDGTLSCVIANHLVRSSGKQAKVIVVDYTQELTQIGSPSVQLERRASLKEVSGDRFDLVLASAVLEHIPRPRQVLLDLLNVLRPGGSFYARTPWVAPLLKATGSIGLSADFTYPAHVHDLGGHFWNGILEHLPLPANEFRVITSTASIIETSFRKHLGRTTLAFIMKLPARVLGPAFPFVGGWEAYIERRK